MILAGDIGGTKCNLALYESESGETGPKQLVKRHYESRGFPAFDQLIAKFLSDTATETKQATVAKIEAAGFGIAGPVIDNQVKVTNLPWIVDGAALQKQLATPHVVLLNDLEATGYGLALVSPAEISMLNKGVPVPHATRALIAAGTGLGEAILFWNGDRYVVASSEGGHADFAPRTEQEIELLRHMKKTDQFVSAELILTGRGFRVVHEFLDPSVQHPSFHEPGADPAPEITHLALTGQCPVCVKTLDLWVGMYGSAAGNLALTVLARGGVWIAGGIAVKIRKKMEDGAFFKAFCAKEKFGALLAEIPIQLVLNEEAPLLGAMSQAARAAGLPSSNAGSSSAAGRS